MYTHTHTYKHMYSATIIHVTRVITNFGIWNRVYLVLYVYMYMFACVRVCTYVNIYVYACMFYMGILVNMYVSVGLGFVLWAYYDE